MSTVSTPSLSIPTELKKVTQYIRRAEELDRDRTYPESRLVAYYLRQYACQIGISSISSSSDSIQAKECLGSILNNLEGEKKAMSNFTKKEAQFLCRGFAVRVWDKANEQDLAVFESVRATTATNNNNNHVALDCTMQQVFKDIAQAFYAAGTFYDILQQFYDDSASIVDDEERKEENKRRLYCKYKATNILKALKEGKMPSSTLSQQEDGTLMEDSAKIYSNVNQLEPQQRNSIPSAPLLPPPSNNTDILDIPTVPFHHQTPSLQSTSAPTLPPLVTSPWTSYMDSSIPLIPVVPIQTLALEDHSFDTRRLGNSESCTSGSGGGDSIHYNKGKQTVSKIQLSDARELTHFAMAALDAKDADLAAERLQSALEALGRR